MGYYWVTTAQEYLQHLGFGSRLRPVNQRQIELRINQFGGDNSFFRDDKANITIGKGGVDDGEDAEVIVHEYGHSVQDGQVPEFGTNAESGSDRRGVQRLPRRRRHELEGRRADADARSLRRRLGLRVLHVEHAYCLRRIDGNKHYPEDIEDEVGDGECVTRCGTSAPRSATPRRRR